MCTAARVPAGKSPYYGALPTEVKRGILPSTLDQPVTPPAGGNLEGGRPAPTLALVVDDFGGFEPLRQRRLLLLTRRCSVRLRNEMQGDAPYPLPVLVRFPLVIVCWTASGVVASDPLCNP